MLGKTLYFDYQASTPLDKRAFKVMQPFFLEHFGNPHSNDHIMGWTANSAIEKARTQVAHSINSDADEIVFTSGATESNNLALMGFIDYFKATNKNKIIISSIEHKCIINTAKYMQTQGFEVNIIPVTHEGLVDLDTLETLMDNGVSLVSVMAVNNEIGSIQPITEIAHLCQNHGALFHTDAAQALATMNIDVSEMSIDLLSMSSHKIYGPKGIGALYIRRDLQQHLNPLIHGGGQENGMRSGTLDTPSCVGFGEACGLLYDDPHEKVKLSELRDLLWTELKNVYPSILLNGPSLRDRHCGNLNIQFPGEDAKDLLSRLQPHLAASTGSACTSGTPEPSYVLQGIGLTIEQAKASLRLSVGRFTTRDDVMQAIKLLSELELY